MSHDGFGLGAQRRKIKENDLPLALEIIKKYKQSIIESKEIEFNLNEAKFAHVVKKEKIAESGDYNLTGDRYKRATVYNGKWDFVELGEVCKDRGEYGSGAKKIIYDGNVRYVRITDIDNEGNLKATDIVSPSIIEEKYFLQKGDLLFARSGSVGRCYLHKLETGKYQFAGYLIRFKTDRNKILPNFIFYLTKSEHYWNWIKNQSKTGTLTNINAKQFSSFKIPLLPLEIQEQIVAELGSYQKIIDGAKQVVENYKPTFKIDPEWEMVEIGEICRLINGRAFKPQDWEKKSQTGLPIIRIQNLNNPSAEFNYYSGKVKDDLIIQNGDLLFSWSGSRGTSFGPHIWNKGKAILNQHIYKVKHSKRFLRFFLFLILKNAVSEVEENLHGGVGLVHITKGNLEKIKIPLPPIEIQQKIVAQIEDEQKIIDANKELITIFENKIKDKIANVWGE